MLKGLANLKLGLSKRALELAKGKSAHNIQLPQAEKN